MYDGTVKTKSYWLEHTYQCRHINNAQCMHRYKVTAVRKGERRGPTIHQWRGN